MKKLLLFGLVFLMVLPVVLSTPSEDRTQYYLNRTNYFADNIESTNEKNLLGNLITDNMQSTDAGWTTVSGRHRCLYSDSAPSIYKGSYVINCTGTQDDNGYEEELFAYIDNSSFTGKLGFALYPVSGYTSAYGIAFNTPGADAEVYVIDSISASKWTCGEPAGVRSVCGGGKDINFDTWNIFVLNWTGTDVELWIDGQLNEVFNGYTGLTSIKILSHLGDSKFYIDDIWMSSGDRPQAQAPSINASRVSAIISDFTTLGGVKILR